MGVLADRRPLTADRHLPHIILAIAEVGLVAEAAAVENALVAADRLGVVALLDTAKGRADIFEFVVDVQRNLAETDDQTEDRDGRNQHQFRRDNETGFVILKGSDELEHGRVFRAVGVFVTSMRWVNAGSVPKSRIGVQKSGHPGRADLATDCCDTACDIS